MKEPSLKQIKECQLKIRNVDSLKLKAMLGKIKLADVKERDDWSTLKIAKSRAVIVELIDRGLYSECI